MPVKRIDFEARKQSDMAFQVVDWNETSTAVVHKTAQFEGGPVGDGHGFDGRPRLVALGQLLKRLRSANHTRRRHRLNQNQMFCDRQAVSLVFIAVEPIVESTRNRIDEPHFHPTLRLFDDFAVVFLEDIAQQPTIRRVAQRHLPTQQKHLLADVLDELLRTRKQVRHTSIRQYIRSTE